MERAEGEPVTMQRRAFLTVFFAALIPSGDCAKELERANYQLAVKQARIESLEWQLKAVQADLKEEQDKSFETAAKEQADIIEKFRLEDQAWYEAERDRKCKP